MSLFMDIRHLNQPEIPAHLPREDIKAIWAENPMRIIVMLFDKALLHISRARATATGWSDESYQTSVLNAVDVIERLQMTLALEHNSAMAVNLDDLYRYVTRLLIDSIQQKNAKDLDQASHLLMQIRESLSIFVKKLPQMLQH